MDELTDTEKDIYRRGRNAKSHTMAKNATVTDYRSATGFEALMGYLYLTDQMERMMEVVSALRWNAVICYKRGKDKEWKRHKALTIEGRNAVLEAFRSGKTIDKLFLLDGCVDGPIRTIHREAKKHDTIISYVTKRASGSDF